MELEIRKSMVLWQYYIDGLKNRIYRQGGHCNEGKELEDIYQGFARLTSLKIPPFLCAIYMAFNGMKKPTDSFEGEWWLCQEDIPIARDYLKHTAMALLGKDTDFIYRSETHGDVCLYDPSDDWLPFMINGAQVFYLKQRAGEFVEVCCLQLGESAKECIDFHLGKEFQEWFVDWLEPEPVEDPLRELLEVASEEFGIFADGSSVLVETQGSRPRGQFSDEIIEHIEDYFDDGVAEILRADAMSTALVDVLYIAPNKNFNYHLFVSSGVSNVKKLGDVSESRQEYIMYFPVVTGNFREDVPSWAFATLQTLIKGQYFDSQILVNKDLVPNTPFAGIGCLRWVRELPNDFLRWETLNGETMNFYTIVPLYAAEMNYLRYEAKKDVNKVLDPVLTSGIFDLNRSCVVKMQ